MQTTPKKMEESSLTPLDLNALLSVGLSNNPSVFVFSASTHVLHQKLQQQIRPNATFSPQSVFISLEDHTIQQQQQQEMCKQASKLLTNGFLEGTQYIKKIR
jgi:hypothetical protein